MTENIDVSIRLEVKCSKCKYALNFTSSSVCNLNSVDVEPCQHCTEEEYERGKADAEDAEDGD